MSFFSDVMRLQTLNILSSQHIKTPSKNTSVNMAEVYPHKIYNQPLPQPVFQPVDMSKKNQREGTNKMLLDTDFAITGYIGEVV